MDERVHPDPDSAMPRDDQREENCDCGKSDACDERKGELLHARRKVLIGSVGLSAFAATLASRPAFAGQTNGGVGPLTALCSPTHSGTQQTSTCVGHHADYWCTNKSAWPIDCRTRLSSCFPGISFTGCDQTFQQALCSAYQQSSQGGGGGWGGGGWGGGGGHYSYSTSSYSMNNFSQQWGSGYYQQSGSYYNYMTVCNTNNIACWLAVGYCNAASPSTNQSFCYDTKSFVNACATAFQSKCYANVEQIICQTVSSSCPVGRQTQGCGPSPNNWVGSWS
jgi:hypothetical protein